MNKQIEQKLSSREVAPMMDIRHDSLLRKIDKINEDLADHKIVVSKYWVICLSLANTVIASPIVIFSPPLTYYYVVLIVLYSRSIFNNNTSVNFTIR